MQDSQKLIRLLISPRSSETQINSGGLCDRSGTIFRKDMSLSLRFNKMQCSCAGHFTPHLEEMNSKSSILIRSFCVPMELKNRCWVSRLMLLIKLISSHRPRKFASSLRLDTTAWSLKQWDTCSCNSVIVKASWYLSPFELAVKKLICITIYLFNL